MQRKEFTKEVSSKDASKIKVGIVLSEFNPDITESMLEGAISTLSKWQVSEKNIKIYRVSGSFELTHACDRMVKKHEPHAIVALGCIIKGDTDHDQYLASAIAHGLTDLTIKHRIPISFGVLTTNNLAQARVRSSGETNHGASAAAAALQAALL